MEIRYFKELDSTQKYLTSLVRENKIEDSLAIICENQTKGIGSRGNSWEGEKGNFFASVALKKEVLPNDLPIESASIYFGWLMIKLLKKYEARVWLKWPNDIYFEEDKVGGVITSYLKDYFVVGVGINLKDTKDFKGLNISLRPKEILERFLNILANPPSWRNVFDEFEIEFEKSRKFLIHNSQALESLKSAKLQEDGSLIIDGKKVVSLR